MAAAVSRKRTTPSSSAPDHRGDMVASVLIPAPRFRVSPETLQALGESCAAAARRVTGRLGGTAPRMN
jgi:DNA-binding IclR family transcriptional regulator